MESVSYKNYELKFKEIFKSIKVKEFIEYCNKYVGNGLEVGKQYEYNGIDSIHYVMKNNIEKGLFELYNKYGISVEDIKDIIKVSTWNIVLYIQYDEVSIWENIIKYNVEGKQRSNASVSNSRFTLLSIPKCVVNTDIIENMVDIIHNFNSMNIEEMSLDEVITYLLEGKRQKEIGRIQSEILSLKRQINDKKKVISKLEDLII